MKELSLNGNTILLVEVPEGATIDTRIVNGQFSYQYKDKQGHSHYAASGIPKIPEGFSILGPSTADRIGEEDAKPIAEKVSSGRISGRPQYRSYVNDKDLMPATMWTRDPVESVQNFLRSQGFSELQKLVILIKQ